MTSKSHPTQMMRVEGREAIIEALEYLVKHYRTGAICGFTVYADVDQSGRFAMVMPPGDQAVDEDDLPPVPVSGTQPKPGQNDCG